jgi:hypothetical protein
MIVSQLTHHDRRRGRNIDRVCGWRSSSARLRKAAAVGIGGVRHRTGPVSAAYPWPSRARDAACWHSPRTAYGSSARGCAPSAPNVPQNAAHVDEAVAMSAEEGVLEIIDSLGNVRELRPFDAG